MVGSVQEEEEGREIQEKRTKTTQVKGKHKFSENVWEFYSTNNAK